MPSNIPRVIVLTYFKVKGQMIFFCLANGEAAMISACDLCMLFSIKSAIYDPDFYMCIIIENVYEMSLMTP